MPAKATHTQDITVYPTEEKLGEDLLQTRIVELLRPLIERYLAERGLKALTGADQFIYFRQGDIRYRLAPDVFILPGVAPDREVRSWKVWEERVVPSLAIEVVSTNVDKDYIDNPPLYRELGVRELIIFDPQYEHEEVRYRFQVYRQVGKRGLVLVTVTNEDRVVSKELKCFLRAVGEAQAMRLRLGGGKQGDELYPTEAERERADKERERADKERERGARLEAEAAVQQLRDELERLRKKR